MDARIDQLRAAHDALVEWFVGRLVGVLESIPIERAVLDLFCEPTLAADLVLASQMPVAGPAGSPPI